jgi:hypothetical protein
MKLEITLQPKQEEAIRMLGSKEIVFYGGEQ